MLKKTIYSLMLMNSNDGGGANGGGGGNSSGGQGAGGGQSGSGTGGGANANAGGSANGNSQGAGSGSSRDPLLGDGGNSNSNNGSNSNNQGGAGNSNSNGQGGGDPSKPVIPNNWKDALPDELKNAPFMQNVPDIPTLVKNYENAQKMVGADKLPIPGKHANDDDWKETMHKLGNPRSVAEYKFEIEKGVEIDKEFIEKFTAEAHKLGILPRQAGPLANFLGKLNAEVWDQSVKQSHQRIDDGIKALQKEWGNTWDENIVKGKAAIAEFADQDMIKHFKESGMSSDPQFIKFMAKVGASFSEDKLRGFGPGAGGGGMSPSAAQTKINEINADRKHPYWDSNHSGHAAAKKEMTELYEMANPKK